MATEEPPRPKRDQPPPPSRAFNRGSSTGGINRILPPKREMNSGSGSNLETRGRPGVQRSPVERKIKGKFSLNPPNPLSSISSPSSPRPTSPNRSSLNTENSPSSPHSSYAPLSPHLSHSSPSVTDRETQLAAKRGVESLISPRVTLPTTTFIGHSGKLPAPALLPPPPPLLLPGQTPEATHTPEELAEMEEKRIRLRGKTITEIIQTERDYVESIILMREVFITPLQQSSLVDPRDLQLIFSNVEILLNINTQLLDDLSTVSGDSDRLKLAQIFLSIADFLKAYKSYALNQTNALQTLDKIKKTEKIKAYLDTLETDPRLKGVQLTGFLIKPVQRVTKYPLLLRELIRYTEENDENYNVLIEAHKKLTEIVDYINEAHKNHEHMARLLDLQSEIEGVVNLVIPSRKLMKEGILTYKKSPHTIFLFSDLLLICTQNKLNRILLNKKVSYVLIKQLDLAKARVINVADSVCWNAFEVQCGDELVRLQAEHEGEKMEWFNAVKDLIKEHLIRKHDKDHIKKVIA